MPSELPYFTCLQVRNERAERSPYAPTEQAALVCALPKGPRFDLVGQPAETRNVSEQQDEHLQFYRGCKFAPTGKSWGFSLSNPPKDGCRRCARWVSALRPAAARSPIQSASMGALIAPRAHHGALCTHECELAQTIGAWGIFRGDCPSQPVGRMKPQSVRHFASKNDVVAAYAMT